MAQRQGLGADPRKQTPPGVGDFQLWAAPLRVVKAAAFWTASPGRAAGIQGACHAHVPLI